MQVYHKFPCLIYAIIPNTVSLVAFYWNHKPLAGGRRLGEYRGKVELAQSFEKCDEILYTFIARFCVKFFFSNYTSFSCLMCN